MKVRPYTWMFAAAIAASHFACDDKNDLPPEVIRAAQADSRPKVEKLNFPTTQELKEAPRQTMALPGFPLTISVPKSWSLNSYSGDLVMLGGPASSGEIDIQLVQNRQSIPANRVDAAVAEAKRDVDAKPHAVNRVRMKSIGKLKVLETRMLSNTFVNGKPEPEQWGTVEIKDERSNKDDRGNPIATTRAILNPHLVRWSFTIFIPDGSDKYTTRGLTFMSLKLSEFEQDREFLEEMMESLKYQE